MTYILLFLVILLFSFVLISRFNKFSLYFLGIISSLIIGLYSTLLLISISGNYSSIGYAFGSLDRKIFHSLIQNRITLFGAIRFFNFSVMVYPTTLVLFTMSYFKTKRNLILKILLIIFSIFGMFFYEPKIVSRIYFLSVADESQNFYNLISYVDLFLHSIRLFLTAVPFIFFYKIRTIQTAYKRKQLYGISLFVLLTDFIYYSIINISSLQRFYIGNEPYSLIQVRTYGAHLEHEYLIYLILMFACVLMLFYVAQKFYLVRTNGKINRFFLRNRSLRISKNILGIFHAIKNVIYSYKITIDNINKMEEPQKSEALEKLSTTMNDYVNHISSMTNSNSSMDNLLLEKADITNIVINTTKSTPPPQNVNIEYIIPDHPLQVYVDVYYMEMAISNILKNAYEAVTESKKAGTVTIKIFSEFDLTVVDIIDTGLGIDKKTISNMFKPFYTTKSRILNWGVGLSFTKRIIRMHDGNISVNSKKNIGTEICIILPSA